MAMYSKDLVEKVLQLRQTGLNRQKIAKEVGLDYENVVYILKKHKIKITREQYNANLKEAQTEELQTRKSASSIKTFKEHPEIAINRSAKTKQTWIDNPELKKNHSETFKQKWTEPEYKKSVIDGLKVSNAKPEVKEKLSKRWLGKIRPHLAVHTFSEVYEACAKNNLLFLKEEDPNKLLYKSSAGNWPIQCLHNGCGNVIYPDLSILINRETPYSCGCIRSLPEIQIRELVKSICPDTLPKETRELIPPFGIDIYLPSKKLAIEHCGLFYHDSNHKKWNYHYTKMMLCKEKDVRLITIFEDEWLFKKQQVSGYLRAIINKDSLVKEDARKCIISKIEINQAIDFINLNHIQNYVKSLVSYGLFNKSNELIGVACFGQNLSDRKEINSEKSIWQLHRYAVKIGYNVRGGLGKLLKEFVENNSPSKIITYSDNRWSTGKLYESTGFIKTKEGNPSYYYFNKDLIRIHKSNLKKSKIKTRFPEVYSETKTEKEMSQELGYNIIWDCGKTRWELTV
jgi:hypothetical protein